MRHTGEYTCQAGITFGTEGLEAFERFKSDVRMEMLEGWRGKKNCTGEDSALAVFWSENVGIHKDINQSPNSFQNSSLKITTRLILLREQKGGIICNIFLNKRALFSENKHIATQFT